MSQAVLLWPCCGHGPHLWGVLGPPTACTSGSLLVKAWLEGSERMRDLSELWVPVLRHPFLGSPHLRPACETTWARGADVGERSLAWLWRGFHCHLQVGPRHTPFPSLSSVFLGIPQGLPRLRCFLCSKSLILGSVLSRSRD